MSIKIGGPRSYPDFVEIGESPWEIKFVRKFYSDHMTGECDPSSCKIYIKLRLSRLETFKTFIHECVHGIEEENDIDIDHDFIHCLDEIFGRAAVKDDYGFRTMMSGMCAPAPIHEFSDILCADAERRFRKHFDYGIDKKIIAVLAESLAHFLIVNFSQIQQILYPRGQIPTP